MSDNRLSVTDGHSLCKCPAGGVLPLAGRFRLLCDVLSLARRCCAAIRGWKGWCISGWC